MSDKNSIQIDVSLAELRRELRDRIIVKEPHRDLIVNTIIDNLAKSEVGLEQLFKAFSGIKVVCPFPMGTKFKSRTWQLSLYSADTDTMKAKGIIRNDMMEVTLIDFEPNKKSCLVVEYDYLDKSGNPQRNTTNVPVSEAYLEQYPFDEP